MLVSWVLGACPSNCSIKYDNCLICGLREKFPRGTVYVPKTFAGSNSVQQRPTLWMNKTLGAPEPRAGSDGSPCPQQEGPGECRS